MRQVLDSKAAHDLVSRAVTTLAGREAAKRVAPSVEAVFELARKTATSGSAGKRNPVITSVEVSTGDSDGGHVESVTTVFSKRTPIASGPKKRVPIRTGGGTCFTVKIGKITVKVCIEWEN